MKKKQGSQKPLKPSISHSFIIKMNYPNLPGMLARVTKVIGDEGGDLGNVEILGVIHNRMNRRVTFHAADEKHADLIVKALRKIKTLVVEDVTDEVLKIHEGGKIAIRSKLRLDNRDTLSMAYTPGVARVCQIIAADPLKAFDYTIKKNSVAVVTDGTAVLGLGDIGPEAAMPVMEGKAMLFKEYGAVDAYPICLRTKDVDEIVETICRISPGFGGINLEDISAPRCFEIEEKLKERLDIPVFHDDQHGTAVVVLAAMINACKLTNKKIKSLKVVIVGAGAAGVAIAKILMSAGCSNIIMCDRMGAIHKGRTDLNPMKKWLADHTNPKNEKGGVQESLKKSDVFVGVSGPGIVEPQWLKAMNPNGFVFALANPVPEVPPEEAMKYAAIVATGRSDYPNQINNVLAFPGIFRGALDVRARKITEGMKVAAARAIARCVAPSDLAPDNIIPSVFDYNVGKEVARAVRDEYFANIDS